MIEERIVQVREGGVRLDAALLLAVPTTTRAFVRDAIAEGRVFVDGRVAPKGLKLRGGETIRFTRLLEEADNRVLPREGPLAVVFEDASLVALDKPAAQPVQPLSCRETGTLMNAVVSRYPECRDLGDAPLMAGALHRIDADTSGLVLVARTPEVFTNLRAQFSAQTVKKTYLALVEGCVAAGGTLENDLIHDPTLPFCRMVDVARARLTARERAKARPLHAVTTFTPLSHVTVENEERTLLEVTIYTGVTHQIRAQLALAGHHIVNDRLYGAFAVEHQVGHCLHALAAKFIHPRSGVETCVQTPYPAWARMGLVGACLALLLGPLAAFAAHPLPFTITHGTNAIPVKAVAGACARIAPTEGGVALEVVDPKPNKWPAVYFNFDGTFDLERVGEVRVRVRNPSDAAEQVSVKVKAVTQQGQMPSTSIGLAGGARRTLRLPLGIERFVFDKDPHLKGLKRHPKVGGGASYTLAKTYAITVFLPPMSVGGKFVVEAVELVPADGREKPRVLKADQFCPWVDAFGQATFADYPAKIHSADDLKRQYRAECAELAARPEAIPNVDEYGGWAGGPQLKATGRFRTEKVDGRWWLVDPAGHLYFAQGLNCGWDLTPTAVQHREEYFESLPPKEGLTKRFWTLVKTVAYRNYYSDPTKVPYWAFSFQRYNLYRKYGENYIAANEVMQSKRCHAWGINCLTGASWGLRQKSRIPYHTSFDARSRPIATAKGYWGELLDPFAPEFETNCLKAAAALVKVKDDPWCIGCTVNNELSWGPNGATLARTILQAGDDQPAKVELVKLLAARGKTPETASEADCRGLGLAVAERYYSTVRRALKRVAPDMLYLGDRNDKRNPEVLIAASRFCDVVTVNTYDFQASVELPTGAEDRPLWVTEFHFGCYDTGYFYASLIPVASQAVRAEAYRAFLRSAIDSPSYVGANWFCWRDQPITGVIGESANSSCGVVSVTDIPYRELTEAMKTIAAEMYPRHQNASPDCQLNARAAAEYGIIPLNNKRKEQ